MHHFLIALALVASAGSCSIAQAQSGANEPHATLHFVFGKNALVPNCEKKIIMVDQKDFKVKMPAMVNYTIYTEGRIGIIQSTYCAGTKNGSGAGNRGGSEDLFVDVAHGQDYYINMTGVKFELSTKEDLAKQLAKITDITELQESRETPITPVTDR